MLLSNWNFVKYTIFRFKKTSPCFLLRALFFLVVSFSKELRAVNYFRDKNSMADVRMGSKYASDYCPVFLCIPHNNLMSTFFNVETFGHLVFVSYQYRQYFFGVRNNSNTSSIHILNWFFLKWLFFLSTLGLQLY